MADGPDFFLRGPTWSGERARFLDGFPRKFGTLDGWMLALAPVVKTTFLFLHDVNFEKRGFEKNLNAS